MGRGSRAVAKSRAGTVSNARPKKKGPDIAEPQTTNFRFRQPKSVGAHRAAASVAADFVAVDADTGAAVARALVRVHVGAVAAESVHGPIYVRADDGGITVEAVFELNSAIVSPAARRERQRPEERQPNRTFHV
jgi:hypothetical protein